MTDTRFDSTLVRIEWVTDRLARINCSKVSGVTIYEEDELVAELGRLNCKLGHELSEAFAPRKFLDFTLGKVLASSGGIFLFACVVSAAFIIILSIMQIAVQGISSSPTR